YLWQEIPTQNIKPFLTMNIRKNTLVNYMLAKTFLSAFSWLTSLFFITFSLIALFNGYLWQEIPTQNIKPFLTMNIRKNTLVNYMLAKT
ncbi:DUF5687 family protein, partial [Chryseobacterium sp. CH1]|uniref:DUF5687 family protein n=1 Tax=Chryseobacterium sp. CH1 TaxID=713551 RepID=UPI001026B75E